MKKYAILALSVILTASLLAGCRNPNMDTDTNPGNTSTPTGSSTDTTTEATIPHHETQPQTTAPTTLPQTDPTTEDSTLGTEDTSNNGGVESRTRRRMPGM